MREKLIDIIECYADFLDWDRKEDMVDSIMEKCFATDNNVGGKWIPVSERLPEEPGPFLIVVKSKYPFDRDYSYETDFATYRWDGKGRLDGCWDALADWGDGEEYIHVTHWMPLPEPPKGE